MAPRTEGKVKAIVAKFAKRPPEKIPTAADLRKLGIDSLMALEVVSHLERAFKIHIPEGRIRGIVRVDQIVHMLDELRAATHVRAKTSGRVAPSSKKRKGTLARR